MCLWPGAAFCGACRGAKCRLPAHAALLAPRTCSTAVRHLLRVQYCPFLNSSHRIQARHVVSANERAAHAHTGTRLQCASRWRKQQCVLPGLASAAAARLRARPRPAAGPELPLGPCRVPAGLAHEMLPPLTSMRWIGDRYASLRISLILYGPACGVG